MTKINPQREEDENRIVRLRSSQEKVVDWGNIFQCPISHERRGEGLEWKGIGISDNDSKEYEGEEYQERMDYASVRFFLIRE